MVATKKKNAVYGVIALMLVVAVYLNWSYVRTPDDLAVSSPTAEDTDMLGVSGVPLENAEEVSVTQHSEQTEVVATADFFTESRLSREQARDEAISILQDTIANEQIDQASKSDVTEQIAVIAENSVEEAKIESLIKAKGYAEAVVFIGDSSVNVIVQPPEEGLQATDASVIRDIVVSETNVTADAIKIVEAS